MDQGFLHVARHQLPPSDSDSAALTDAGTFRHCKLGLAVSGTWWKAVAACLFYALCIVGIIAGITTVSWPVVGFYLSVLVIGILVVLLISYRGVRPANVAILASLLIAFAGFGVSAVNAPTQRTASQRGEVATPQPSQPPPASRGPIESLSASATPSPTPTSSPTPSPTPTPRATSVATPTQIPAPPPPPKNLCGAPSNPWGYNFCGRTTISSPPTDVQQVRRHSRLLLIPRR